MSPQPTNPFKPALLRSNGGLVRYKRRVCGLISIALQLTASANSYAGGRSDSGFESNGHRPIEGEILDMALDYCRRGEKAQAHALFHSIREQLNPPLPVLEIIAGAEASGCKPPTTLPSILWGAQLGAGYDNNVNQGISTQTMSLGSGLNAIELQLGDAYKPRGSPYVVAGLESSFRLGEFAIGQVALQHRENRDVPVLNLTSLVASAIRPFTWAERPGRVQIDLGETWLGGVNYQRAGSAGVQWLLTDGEQPWLGSLSALRTSYANQPDQDNLLMEAGVWRQRQLASTFGIFGGISALYDHALRQRPGGERMGLRYQLGFTTAWSEWLIQPRLNVLQWKSSEVFSPGLIDIVRRHSLAQLDVQVVRPVAQNQQMVVEWRFNLAHDTVPLFSYRAQSVAVYWRLLR